MSDDTNKTPPKITQPYRCVEPIDHDQVRYEPGAEIELEPKQAKRLLAIGHIVDPSALVDDEDEAEQRPVARPKATTRKPAKA